MTALPATIPDSAAVVEDAIRKTRAATPQAVEDQRQSQRLSIAELNQLDLDDVQQRLYRTRFDDRTPVQQVLDIIDLPRNALFNAVAPGLARRQKERGEAGAAGLGRLTFSDVLGEVGMEPGLARGILGFTGDVVFDPLTYVGPAGWGAKATSGGAKVGRLSGDIGLRGSRALKGGIGAAARAAAGRSAAPLASVQDETVRNLLRVSGFDDADLLRLAAEGKGAKEIEGAIRDNILGRLETGRVGRAARIIGGDLHYEGGTLARGLTDPGISDDAGRAIGELVGETPVGRAQVEASREFFRQFGKGSIHAPGLRIGPRSWKQRGGGSGVAHVPFTEIEVRVPGFSAAGRQSEVVQSIVKAAPAAGLTPEAARALGETNGAIVEALELSREEIDAFGGLSERVRSLDAELVPLNEEAGRIATENAQTQAAIDALSEKIRPMAQDVAFARQMQGLEPKVFDELTEADIPELRVELRQLREARAKLRELIDRGQRVESARSVVQATREAAIAANAEASALVRARLAERLAQIEERGLTLPIDDSVDSIEDILQLGKVQDVARSAADRARALEGVAKQIERDGLPAGLESASASVKESISSAVAAAVELARKSESALLNHLTNTEQDAVRVAATVLGSGDAAIGASAITPFALAFRGGESGRQRAMYEHVSRLDRTTQKLFGRRGGYLNRVRRHLERSRDIRYRNTLVEVATLGYRELNSIASRHKVAETEKDQLLTLAYAMMHVQEDGGRAVFPVKPWIDGAPMEIEEAVRRGHDSANFATSLYSARQAGLLSKHPGLEADLAEFAGKNRAMLRELGDLAEEEGVLGSLMDNYVPILPSEAGREGLAIQRGARGFGKAKKGSGGDSTTAREAFQRPRSTWQYRFQDEDGQWHRFFLWQRAYEGMPSAAKAAMSPEDLAAVESALEAMRKYDALETKPPPMPTDAIELNALQQQGYFDVLTGKHPEAFFDTNLVAVMAARSAMAQRAHARKHFRDIVETFGVAVPAQQILEKGRVKDGYIELPNGVRARTLGKNPPEIEIGGVRFRQLNRDILNDENPITGMIGTGGESLSLFYSPEAASLIEQAAGVFRSEASTNAFLSALDTLQGHWKSITLFHPSWQIAEMIGGVHQAAMMFNANPRSFAGWIAKVPQAMRMWARVNANPDAVVKFAGREMSYGQLAGLLDDLAVTHASRLTEAALQAAMQGFDAVKGAPVPKAESAQTAPWRLAAGLAVKPWHGYKRALGTWFRMNQVLNNSLRTAAFMQAVEEGDDMLSAAGRVVEHFFDFDDMTPFEANVRRFALPFLSWMRNNMAYQVRRLFDRPAFVASYPKILTALEEMIEADEEVPQSLRPGWMRDQMAVFIGKNPGRTAFLTRSIVPLGDALEALTPIVGQEGVQDFMHYFVSALNPVVRTPLEIGAGREFFSGRSIGPSLEEADVTLPGHVVRQIRPLSELGIGTGREGPLLRSAQQGIGPLAGRLVLGGRLQAADDERLRTTVLANLEDVEKGIRRAIRRAEREGREDLSLRARVRLMALYKHMVQIGLGDAVPKWARTQLAEIGATGTTL